MMRRKTKLGWAALGVLAVLPALAPPPDELVQVKVGELKTLADERVKVCERMLDFYRDSAKAPPAPGDPGKGPGARYLAGYEPIHVWMKHLLEAKLDGTANLDGRVKLFTEEIGRLKALEAELARLEVAEPEWKIAIDLLAFSRLELEYRLAKEKATR